MFFPNLGGADHFIIRVTVDRRGHRRIRGIVAATRPAKADGVQPILVGFDLKTIRVGAPVLPGAGEVGFRSCAQRLRREHQGRRDKNRQRRVVSPGGIFMVRRTELATP